jgi:catechol 2,3-dioxygenase-like lactoylglutathione lyase family enzyme
MPATKINHISIGATDLEVSVAFYEDLLGLTRIPTYAFGFPVQYLRVGATQLHIFERPGDAPVFQHFALEVDDFNSVYRAAEAMGIFDHDTFHGHAYELPDGGVQLYVRDPARNLVEFDWPDASTVDPAIRACFGTLDERVPQVGDALRATLFMNRLAPDGVTADERHVRR